jgi:SAM-dependent methyltransferase
MPEWPGAARRRPRLTSPTYAIRAPLAVWLKSRAAAAAEAYGPYSVLDVGCGPKPYFPIFAPYAGEYVGIDLEPGADLQGSAEALPVADQSFDVVVCTQVLEHCEDPALAVRELRRVARPGGRVLASTHGTMVYHPDPGDYWRWTHAGLERLFHENGEWSALTVSPGSGTTACVAMLVVHHLDLLFRRARIRPLGRPFVAMINVVALGLDRTTPLLREPVPGSIFANYHVEAVT